MERRYVVGSGWFAKPGETGKDVIHKRWLANVRQAYPNAKAIFIVSHTSKHPDSQGVQWIDVPYNMGSVQAHDNDPNPPLYCGCMAAYLSLAMLAYTSGADFIYQEWDELVFGPILDTMYEDARRQGLDVLIGKSDHRYGSDVTLTFMRHSIIPFFVQAFTSIQESDSRLRPECKFTQLVKKYPQNVGFFSFDCGEHRPLNMDAKVWYANKFTHEEVVEAQRRGLLE